MDEHIASRNALPRPAPWTRRPARRPSKKIRAPRAAATRARAFERCVIKRAFERVPGRRKAEQKVRSSGMRPSRCVESDLNELPCEACLDRRMTSMPLLDRPGPRGKRASKCPREGGQLRAGRGHGGRFFFASSSYVEEAGCVYWLSRGRTRSKNFRDWGTFWPADLETALCESKFKSILVLQKMDI